MRQKYETISMVLENNTRTNIVQKTSQSSHAQPPKNTKAFHCATHLMLHSTQPDTIHSSQHSSAQYSVMSNLLTILTTWWKLQV